jgi:excinuclease UvrABC helicase subunit UvrB
MRLAAEKLDFERAIALRERIKKLNLKYEGVEAK